MSALTTPPRRAFLAALSAFVATPAALAVAPAIAAKVEPELVEAPELIELGEKLRAHLVTYRDAAARFAAAREHYERIKPVVPAELIVPPGSARLLTDSLSAPEIDFDGNKVQPPRRIYDRRSLQVHLITQDYIPPRSKEGRRLRRLVRLAKAHEAAQEAAATEAGYWEAQGAIGDAKARLSDFTHKLLQTDPVTLAGARILAEACAGLWEARDRIDVAAHTHTSALGVHLAKALLRLEGGAA